VKALELHFANGKQQVGAVGEVQIDRRGRDADGIGDGPNGQRRLVAVLDQKPFGRLQDLFAQAFALPPPGARPASGRAG
jgi:hypothetical protein